MENIVKAMCVYILDNLDNEISIDDLEYIFCYNKFYLIRLFKSYTGYTVKEFINYVKVLKTVDPLIFSDDTILKIALNNGFNSQEYYSEKFKDIIGISPLKFRKDFSNLNDVSDVEELKAKREYLMYLSQYQQQLLNLSCNCEQVQKLRKIA